MSKRLVIGGVVILLLGIASGALIWYRGGRFSPLKQLPSEIKTENQTDVTTATYRDQAGFSFDYPQNMTVKDVTPQDNLHYSVLELTGGENGKLTIIVRDTDSTTVDQWTKQDPAAPKMAQKAGAAILGGLSAQQYTYSNGAQKILLTVAIDSGIVYMVESPPEWEKTNILIVSTFTRGQNSPATTSSGNPDDGTIYEQEEIVE